jgi:hypothetical protein
MKFKQYKNGSCDIEFNWKERINLLRRGKLHLSDENFRHFSNNLIKIIMDWQLNFNEKIGQQQTTENTEIKTK